MLIFPPPSTLQTLFIEIYEMLNTIFEVKDSCFLKYNASKNEKKKTPVTSVFIEPIDPSAPSNKLKCYGCLALGKL